MKKIYRVLMSALALAAMLLALVAPGALAAQEERCSLTLTFTPEGTPAENVTFRLYRVARVNTQSATFTPVAPYDGYRVLEDPASWLTRAGTLSGYVLRDQLPAAAQAVTDANGVVRFEDLESGLYLILGERIRRGESYWSPVPCFLSLPNSYDGGSTWTPRVEAGMKPLQRPADVPNVDRHVLIVWHDEGYESNRPGQVTVDLLRDGEIYDTVVISANENWRHDWTGLDGSSEWTLVQRDPGSSYTSSMVQEGITFVVTNTYKGGGNEPEPTPTPAPTEPGGGGGGGGGDRPTPTPSAAPPSARPAGTPAPSGEPQPSVVPSADPTPPPEEEDLGENDTPLGDLVNDPDKDKDSSSIPEEEEIDDPDIPLTDLPQTGQLWWPVPLLAILGLGLILCGLIRRKRGEAWDEYQ